MTITGSQGSSPSRTSVSLQPPCPSLLPCPWCWPRLWLWRWAYAEDAILINVRRTDDEKIWGCGIFTRLARKLDLARPRPVVLQRGWCYRPEAHTNRESHATGPKPSESDLPPVVFHHTGARQGYTPPACCSSGELACS